MRLTSFSDYALRLLMFAAAVDARRFTVEEAATAYGISCNHLMKVAQTLTRAGFLIAARGRSGGLTLARKPADIRLGDVIRATEPDFALVECMSTGNRCAITRMCGLPPILNEAIGAFVQAFDRYTLEDIVLSPRQALRAFPSALTPEG